MLSKNSILVKNGNRTATPVLNVLNMDSVYLPKK